MIRSSPDETLSWLLDIDPNLCPICATVLIKGTQTCVSVQIGLSHYWQMFCYELVLGLHPEGTPKVSDMRHSIKEIRYGLWDIWNDCADIL